MHTPVLLREAVEALDVRRGEKYIDATFGEGGHSREIVKRGGRVLALEWDEKNLKFQISNFKSEKLELVWANYADIKKIAQENDFVPCRGVLFDLGLSMAQIRTGGRGFSYKALGEPLDMRISRTIKIQASDLVNSLTRERLYELLAVGAEEIDSGTIVEAIYSARRVAPIKTVGDLVTVIDRLMPRLRTKRDAVLARVFQALRIEVNSEFENLKVGLLGAADIVQMGGRIVVISFHAGEDRIVKRFAVDQGFRFLTPKPVTAKRDSRFERSAKLRTILI